MAGSSTQSVENYTSPGMERHQMMMNTEMMKHLRIMNRTSVREIMLQHEKTFKEQVHDLHKLYEVQRLLMDKAKSRGLDAYTGAPPPSPGCRKFVSEETNHGQRTNFWEQATLDGMGMVAKGGTSTNNSLGSPPKAVLERMIKMEETPKSVVSSPVRKRKIDLEQPPEDDSDDELENSANTLNRTASCLSRNSKESPKVYSGFDAHVKQGPSSHLVSSSLQLQAPAIKLPSGEIDMSRGDNNVKALPSLPLNIMKTEQNFTSSGERNMAFQNAGGMLNTGIGTVQNNTMFLPQADLIDRASQETGKQAHWFLQAPEPNIVDVSVRFPAQQQQRLSPHLALPDHSTGRSQLSTPGIEQRHLNSKSPWIESVGSSMGKVSLERQSPGVSSGAQKDTTGALTERLGDTSKWFMKEPSSQGPPANVGPITRFEMGVTAEGGHGMPGIIAPPMTSQEHDVSLWSSKNPILQAPQYQQPPIFQQHIVPPAGQSVWVQSSQNGSSMYPQQKVVYGLHSSDPPQGGYVGESLQRNQGEIAGSWNMIGLGHYYPSIPSMPQKPPFKKPPKLVLKNDGVGMELKLVSPEKEKATQKKPLNFLKRDSLLASSKSCEINSRVQKQVGEADHKLSRSMSQIVNSTGEAKGFLGISIEPTFLATGSPSSTLTLSQSASTPVTLPCLSEPNLGAVACTTGSEPGSGFNVSASPNTSPIQHNVSQVENVLQRPESQKIAEHRNSSLENLNVTSEKETLLSTNAMTKGMLDQMERGSLLKGEMDMNSGSGALEERKVSLDKTRTSEGNAIDRVASSQSESFNMIPQGVQSKCLEEGVVATDIVQQSAQKLEEDKGSISQRYADAKRYQMDLSECNASRNADSAYPADQPIMQAVSVQSTSTDTPSTSRQEKKRSSIPSDNDMTQRVSGRISTACKNESGSAPSDRDCASAPSPTTLISAGKSEAVVGGVLIEDLEHESDSDNLAATILLSFAPKLDMVHEEKQSKDSISEITSSILKVKPADLGSKMVQSSEGHIGSQQSDYWNRGSAFCDVGYHPGSTRRVEWVDHHDHSKVTAKDRYRREEAKYVERWAGDGEVVTKSLTIKLPRMASGTSNDGAIPISRSKQLSKLNGVSLGGNPVEPFKKSLKGSEAVHTPTGRRSSRGPARAPVESRGRLYQQTQHHTECSPPPLNKDSGKREEEVRSSNKLEGNGKSKAWGELNRARSHVRKQFPEMSHRKSQK